MSKQPIFKTNFVTGSLKESISGDLLAHNGASFQQTGKGLAMGFDRSLNSYIPIDNKFSFKNATSFAVAISFKVTKPSGNYEILFSDEMASNLFKVSIRLQATGELYCGIRDSASGLYFTETTLPLSIGDYFVVFSFDDSYLVTNLYNSLGLVEKVATVSSGLPINSSDNNFELGRQASHELDGIIYDYARYDTLTQTEINNLYKQFLARKQLTVQTKNFTYHKPTRLDEDGLIASYNMIPSANNVLVDISGNGNNGTIVGPLATLDGMAFDGVDDYVDMGNVANMGLGDFNISCRIKTKTTGSDIVVSKASYNIADVGRYWLYARGDLGGIIRAGFGGGAHATTDSITNVCDGNVHTISVNYDRNGFMSLYINGKLESSVDISIYSSVDMINTFDFVIGAIQTGPDNFNGEVQDVKIYNKVLTTQQIKDHHNNYASQVSLLEDFRYAKADGTNVLPLGWIPGTGSYKISENGGLDGNSKALECTSAGAIAIPSTQANGTFEFDLYKKSASGTSIDIISSTSDRSDTNRYTFNISPTGTVAFIRRDISTNTTIMASSSGYIASEIFHRFKITRANNGEFTLFVKGGSFGGAYVLIDSSLIGTNPVIDNTHTISKFSVFDFDSLDKISNIKYTKGVIV